MSAYTRKRYLDEPGRKTFGWSPYTEEIITTYPVRSASKIVCQEAVIAGRKLCFFGKFIWDYQRKMVDYREYKKL